MDVRVFLCASRRRNSSNFIPGGSSVSVCNCGYDRNDKKNKTIKQGAGQNSFLIFICVIHRHRFNFFSVQVVILFLVAFIGLIACGTAIRAVFAPAARSMPIGFYRLSAIEGVPSYSNAAILPAVLSGHQLRGLRYFVKLRLCLSFLNVQLCH